MLLITKALVPRQGTRFFLAVAPAFLLLTTLSACAPTGQPRSAQNLNVIDVENLRTVSFPNVYVLVQSMRPSWLVPCCRDSLTGAGSQIQVYLDDIQLGRVENLRTIPLQGVRSIRWIPPLEASSRWGFDHGQGAILVSMRE